MINQEKLPLKEFKIKENGKEFGSLDAISIVSDPAIEMTFQLFAKANVNQFASTPFTSEKMQITGPVMVPYKKILRVDDNGEYYNGWFSEETIIDCAKNYLRRAKHRQANLEHSEDFYKDFYVFESWIVEDPETDKSKALGFKDIPKGTWFVTYQVTNKELWNTIKNGNYTGFSVEIEAATFSQLSLEEEIKRIVFDETISDEEKENKIKSLIK